MPVAPKISPADPFYGYFVAIRNSEITPPNEPLSILGYAICERTKGRSQGARAEGPVPVFGSCRDHLLLPVFWLLCQVTSWADLRVDKRESGPGCFARFSALRCPRRAREASGADPVRQKMDRLSGPFVGTFCFRGRPPSSKTQVP